MTSMIALRRRRRPEWSRRQPKIESDARDAGDARKRIAYVVNCFPFPTETFVYRELLALRAHGCTILPFSLQSPDPTTLSRLRKGSLVQATMQPGRDRAETVRQILGG